MAFQASCPACAAPVQFDITSSVVAVCPNCGTVCGRGDGALEAFGKVADLVETASPLTIGLRGKYKGVPFTITGRSQLQHSAGGVWDEWYVAFRGGRRWGWLAEAQGQLYLTFRKEIPSGSALPALSELAVDEDVILPTAGNFKVSEIGEATILSGEGEIPYVLKPGETVRYADLSGAGRKFATLDYSDEAPLMFIGGEVTYEKMGIADQVRDREKAGRRVSAVQVNCPSCGGPLELRAPDATQRVACPFCGALNDCSHGKLKFLETLGKKKVEPVIPLGTVGTLTGEMFGEPWSEELTFTVIGFMQRQVTYDGVDYRWQEYLLYRPRTPFHWLIHSEGHWSFGKPISTGDVTVSARTARYDGRTFKIFERSKPVVTYVLGEFYWKVSVGERTVSTDFIAPPCTLSREAAISSQIGRQSHRVALDALPEESIAEEIRDFVEQVSHRPIQQPAPEAVPIEIAKTPRAKTDRTESPREVNYTLSAYFPVPEVERAFGVSGLRRPYSVAPNQPYPYKGVYKAAVGLFAAACLIAMIVFATGRRRQIFSQVFSPPRYQTQSFFSAQPFSVRGHRNLQITCRAPRWVYVSGEFYNEQSGKVRSFGLPSGQSVYLSAMPAGKYTLRLKIEGEKKPPAKAASTAAARRRVEAARRQIAQIRARQQAAARGRTPAGRRIAAAQPKPAKKTAAGTTPVTVTIRQGVPHLSHLLLLFAVLAVVPAGIAVHQMTFEARRWSESDYSPYSG